MPSVTAMVLYAQCHCSGYFHESCSVAIVISFKKAAFCILRISCRREKNFFADTLMGPTLGFLMQYLWADNGKSAFPANS